MEERKNIAELQDCLVTIETKEEKNILKFETENTELSVVLNDKDLGTLADTLELRRYLKRKGLQAEMHNDRN